VPSAPEVVIELFDKGKPKDLTPPVVHVPAAPVSIAAPAFIVSNTPGTSTSCAVGQLDTSHDEEITRKLFIELNCEAIGILGDGSLVILSSDDEEEVTGEEEEDDEEEAKDEPTGSRSPLRS
jgi:hypothetical protein